MHPDNEIAIAINQAKNHPASGVTINKVSPDKPYTASWIDGNGKRIYVMLNPELSTVSTKAN